MAKRRKIEVGDIFISRRFGKCIVLEKHSEKSKIMFFKTKYITTVDNYCLGSGRVRDVYQPTVHGIGYLGEGPFYSRREDGTPITQEYNDWYAMLTRCYSEKYHKIQPTYKDCDVCHEGRNFQNFAKWHYDNCPDNTGQLDKDLLFPGNKIYSPGTCCYLPQIINLNIHSNAKGVCKMKKKWQVKIGNKSYGVYETYEEAHEKYHEFKRNYVMELAIKYNLSDKIRQAIINYPF